MPFSLRMDTGSGVVIGATQVRVFRDYDEALSWAMGHGAATMERA